MISPSDTSIPAQLSWGWREEGTSHPSCPKRPCGYKEVAQTWKPQVTMGFTHRRDMSSCAPALVPGCAAIAGATGLLGFMEIRPLISVSLEPNLRVLFLEKQFFK